MATIADLVIRLSTNSAPAEKDMKSFTGKVQRSFGKALVPAVAVLGVLAVAGKKAADAASNLGESQNAVNVVFGKGAKTISDFSKVADKEAGLSMRQLNELVTPLGAAFTNMGDSQQVAADKSVTLAKRAADMASVFNVDVSEALGAIQAGLRGEADPLERFGVGLSDAAVKAQAMSMGLSKTEAALTAQDKAQARYALLLKQTNKLQGDFKNTSDGAANSARINAASQENLTATIGTGLLPVVVMYQKILGRVTGFMATHTGVVKVAAIALAAIAGTILLVNAATMVYAAGQKIAAAATKVWAAGQWLLNAALSANPVALVILAIIALGLAVVVAYKKSETFRTVVTAVFDAVKFAVLTAVGFILRYIDLYLAGIEGVLRAASKLPIVGDKFKTLADAVGGARDKVRGLQDTINGLKSKSIEITTTITRYERTVADPALGVIGRRAHGGPVRSGLPYLVGEKGPEVFTPGIRGNIIPNGGMSPAGGRDSLRGEGSGPLIGEVNVYNDIDVELMAARIERRLAFQGR